MRNKYFSQLKIVHIEGSRAWAYCPFHEDKIRPNLSISLVDKYYGNCKCWACGKTSKLKKFQMSKLELPKAAASVYTKVNSEATWELFNKKCNNNLKRLPLLSIGLANQLNISKKSLDDWGIGYDGISFTIPMYTISDWGLRACGAQRRFPNGNKKSIKGSYLGFMCPPITKWNEGDGLWICEGFSDSIALHDLGFCSIARPHCHFMDILGAELRELDFWYAYIIPDNDKVGIKGAVKLRKQLVESGLSHCEVIYFDGAKDIRQLIERKGKDYVKRYLNENSDITELF
jgi:DNA primase